MMEQLSDGQTLAAVAGLALLSGVILGAAGTATFGEEVGIVESHSAMEGAAMEKSGTSGDAMEQESGDAMEETTDAMEKESGDAMQK